MNRFEGYPLCAVQENGRIVIYTDAAQKGLAQIFAVTDDAKKALAIVNKVNFFDDLLEALKDCHALTMNTELRIKIGNIIIKATGATE